MVSQVLWFGYAQGKYLPPVAPDGSTMETPGILSDMLSLNPNETQMLTENMAFSDKVYFFIANNQFSEEALAFANAAIDAFVNGGEVDFDEAYISVPTFAPANSQLVA